MQDMHCMYSLHVHHNGLNYLAVGGSKKMPYECAVSTQRSQKYKACI